MRCANRAGQALLLLEFKEALSEAMSTTEVHSDLLVYGVAVGTSPGADMASVTQVGI